MGITQERVRLALCGIYKFCCVLHMFYGGVIIQPSINVIDQLPKKVVLGGASIKESCSAAHTQNKMPIPHEDSLKILVWLIMEIKEDILV